MSESVSSKLYQRITLLRWQAPILAFILVLVHQLLEHTVLSQLPHWWHFTTQVLFYGLVGPVLAYWALTSLRRSVGETEAAEQALRRTHSDLSDANERLAFLIQVNRRLSEAEDEDDLLTMMLDLPRQVVPVVSCSLIRLDERAQPLPALHQGNVDPIAFDSWAAHLMDKRTRELCACCSPQASTTTNSCPVLDTAQGLLPAAKVYCLELRRGDRNYGILNVYLEDPEHPTDQEASLLKAMAQEMSLALESQILRAREMVMLFRLKQANRLSNLQSELKAVLSHTIAAVEAEGGLLLVAEVEHADLRPVIEQGASLGKDLKLVEGLAAGVQKSRSPIIVRDLEQLESHDVRSLLVAPLRTEAQSLGCLVLWSTSSRTFSRRRANLVDIVAGQMALLIENHRLYLQGEYQVALDERARLAREIHDGLAQSLGYLKLRTGQIINWLQIGDSQRAETGLIEVRQLLDEAYVDAREAIDGLSLDAGDGAIDQWDEEILAEFELLGGIPARAQPAPDVELPQEAQVQLQRIVQEALSNIRKHADATEASLDWRLDDFYLTLMIEDNGCGFDPEDVPQAASGQGTQISIVLPLQKVASEAQDG
jgi:two-component system nitrate/nitrite sensor histidine kinase NarX